MFEVLLEKFNKEKFIVYIIVRDMFVFNVDVWFYDIDSLFDLGLDEVVRLVIWFRFVLESGGCRVEVVLREWVLFKVMVKI